MTVAKIMEISAASPDSFDAAMQLGIARAATTIKNITGAWVQDQKVDVENGKIVRYRVSLKVSFILA